MFQYVLATSSRRGSFGRIFLFSHLVRIILRVVQEATLDSKLPRRDRALLALARLFRRIKRVRNEYPQLSFLFHGAFERLLYVQPFSHYRRVQFTFEREQIHVRLRLGHQIAHLLRQYFVRQFFLLLGCGM